MSSQHEEAAAQENPCRETEDGEIPAGEIPDRAAGAAGRFFRWCSGADPSLLATPAERTKAQGLGTLVLVPAVLALFAMTYAVSTISTSFVAALLAGVAWGLVVFCFDRFVVSTARKSESVWRDLASPVFATRFLLAGFIGLIVAHPLVLLYFHDSIDERLDREHAAALEAIDAAYEPRLAAVRAELDGLQREIDAKEAERLEAQALLSREIGGVASDLTTGRYGRGIAAEALEELRDMAAGDLEALRAELPGRRQELTARLEALADGRREARDSRVQARDYIARSRTLESLAAESPEVSRVRWFLILFFVFVDTLPVVFKTLTPRGPYDDRLALEEARARHETGSERRRFRSVWDEMARARRVFAKGDSAPGRRGLPDLYRELTDDLERHQQGLRATLRREEQAIRELADEGQQARQRRSVERLDEAGARVVEQTLERFEAAFLEPEEATPGDRAPLTANEATNLA